MIFSCQRAKGPIRFCNVVKGRVYIGLPMGENGKAYNH